MYKIDQFLNKKYKLYKAENFDDLLAYLKKTYIERKFGGYVKPVQYLSKNDNGLYTLHFSCKFHTYDFDFKPGVEFCEVNGGLTAKAKIIFEGNKLIHTQDGDNGKYIKHIYEFSDEKMTITSTAKGLDCVVKRHYALDN